MLSSVRSRRRRAPSGSVSLTHFVLIRRFVNINSQTTPPSSDVYAIAITRFPHPRWTTNRTALLKIQQRNANRQAADEKAREAKAARAAKPWTKEELAALAKAVKKYPAGGANRWESIALFINNLCKQQDPRGKEECIAQFNKVTSSPSPAAAPGGKEDDAGKSAEAGDEWTDAQDAALQDMLRKYPASMDKNERWSKIAEGVEGKSKKQCVGRFKAIREAVKGKK